MKYRTWAGLFGYAGTSYYFLHNPDKLHMRNMKTQELMKQDKVLFAHRGGSIENPENTIQAFKASNKLGAAIETDVRSTKDGHVLICHDPDFKRLTDKDVKVAEMNLEDLPKRYKSQYPIEFGHHDYQVDKEDVAEYCTLEELFKTMPRSQVIQIDIKDAHDEASCRRVRQLVDKYERANTTILGTARYANMKNIRRAFAQSNALFIASWEDSMCYFGLYCLGLAPFLTFHNTDVFALTYITRDFTAHKLGERAKISPDSLKGRLSSPDYWMLTAYVTLIPLVIRMSSGFISHLDRRGIFTSFWVLNSDDEVEFVAKQMPVRGIMTDRPAAVRKILQNL